MFFGRLKFPTFESIVIQNKERKKHWSISFFTWKHFSWNCKTYFCKHKRGVCVFHVKLWKLQFPNLINFWHGIIIFGETEWSSQYKRKCQSAWIFLRENTPPITFVKTNLWNVVCSTTHNVLNTFFFSSATNNFIDF